MVFLRADLALFTNGELAGRFKLGDLGCSLTTTFFSIGDSQANSRSDESLGGFSLSMIGRLVS